MGGALIAAARRGVQLQWARPALQSWPLAAPMARSFRTCVEEAIVTYRRARERVRPSIAGLRDLDVAVEALARSPTADLDAVRKYRVAREHVHLHIVGLCDLDAAVEALIVEATREPTDAEFQALMMPGGTVLAGDMLTPVAAASNPTEHERGGDSERSADLEAAAAGIMEVGSVQECPPKAAPRRRRAAVRKGGRPKKAKNHAGASSLASPPL